MRRDFLKGFYIKERQCNSKYGIFAFLKGSVKMPEFMANKQNEKGYINFCIFKTKEGKPYAVIDDYEENKETETNDQVIQFDEQMPF